MPYGVLTTGFVPKPLLVLKEEIEAAWRAEFGQNVLLDPNEPDGQIIGIFVDRLAELWELAQAVYSAFDPDKATGQAQDALCALTGTLRRAATRSEVTLTATGTPGTILSTSREASVVVTGDRFRTLAGATITAVPGWAPTTVYTVGQRVTNGGNVYQCITGGTSAGSGGPTGQGNDITDNTVHWRFLGQGTGAIDVASEAVETGEVLAVSGTITVIETPVSGWDGVINVLDAEPGSAVESAEDLRVRREAELTAGGSGTVNAIRADILKLDGVVSCTVYENPTNTTNGDGLPPHSIEAVVQGGDSTEIAEAILANRCAGIEMFGSTTVNLVDSAGNTVAVKFNRPTVLTLWVRVDVTKDPNVFPADGTDQIKAAIVADEENHPIGQNVTASRMASRCFQVPGVLDVTLARVDTVNPPTGTTLTVTVRQLADFDTSRIIVNLADGTP